MDECNFQQHGIRHRMWVPLEVKDPVLLHAPTRKSATCFGAISLQTGTFIRSLCATFKTFLMTLLRHSSRATRTVLDNARYHHTVLLKSLFELIAPCPPCILLPDSPQLALIERVWKLARHIAIHDRFFAILDDVLTAVSTCFDC